jgi:uncharacterized protein
MSAVYEGLIRHRRFSDRPYEFCHRIAMAYVEIDPVGVRALAPAVARAWRLSLPRRFGKLFNPVSFVYCFDTSDRLQSVIAEVTSTPWGDRHSYVLQRTAEGRVLSGEFDKRMHVSPFMSMDQAYVFHAAAPGETLSVHIESRERGTRAFDATLKLRRVAPEAQVRVTTPWRVLALIYSHALVLRLKGVKSYPHPGGVAA